MKDLVLRSADKTVDVHYLVDLIGDNEGITTIHEIRGLSDAEIILGINFKRELTSLGALKKFATDNNLGLFAYETGKAVEVLVDLEPILTLIVVDENGDPVPGITVTTEDDLEDDDSDLTTDDNGEVELQFGSTGVKTVNVEHIPGDDDDDDDSDTREFASQTIQIDMFADQEVTLVIYEVELEDDDS